MTEPNALWKENDILEALNYDLDVPCPLLWGLLWFSSPSRLKRKFANDGTKIAQYRKTANMAIGITRTCSLRAVSVLLCNSPGKDRYQEEELKGWGLGKCPLLPPYSVVDDDLTDA